MTKLPLIIFILCFSLTAPAYAGRGNGHGNENSHKGHETSAKQDESTFHPTKDSSLSLRFSSDDLNIVIGWFANNTQAAAANDSLPPGLLRQLRERGHLPPGLAAKPLPPGLAKKLTPAPRGFDHVLIGHDLVLVELATGSIADVIRNVF